MQILYLLSTALQLLASGALWVVWLRDRRQVFARDIALWYFFASLIILAYPLWLSTNPLVHGAGVVLLAFLYGLAQSFLLMGVHRFLGGAVPQTRTSLVLVGTLVSIYALLILQPNAVQNASAWSAILVCSAGAYAARGLWRRGRLERMAGVLLILVGLCNLILAYGGEAAIPVALALFSVLRLAVAFTFVFAALNRSTTQAERMLERYEQLSEQSLNGIMVMDADRFFYLNPAVVAIYGYTSAQDMVQGGPWTATAPEERAEARAQFSKALEGGRKLTEVEGKRFRADGSPMYLRFSGWPIEWEGRRAMQILVTDETERRQASRALARANEEHRNALIQVNAELERKVTARTQDLAQSNADLAESNERMERTLDTLRSTQAELVQREKLASLGRMVATVRWWRP